MIVFNKDMFEYCKKVKGLTNKAIARLAKVDERTVGKIKKHAALNPDTAEKIALALNKSIEEMTSPIPDDIPR